MMYLLENLDKNIQEINISEITKSRLMCRIGYFSEIFVD